ncbi:RHS repeat-associated core domain-containing protein [Candidatus Woesearchaeota archaeon]|nr:RHS repeat-associated core domain-containing protein [Candidatus Woesearchaeota archaeon]
MLTSQVGSGTIKNYVHDNNGNLTNDGARSYEWDDVNRLTAIIEGTKRFEFTYDGLGRRVKMRDHLGSVREVMKNASSTVEAKYDYDPWGRQTQTTGTRVFDIGYAGYMVFAPSGTNIKLNLTWYRAYSPELGRWLSRDPIGEEGGINLYGYVENRPINTFDPFGLQQEAVLPTGWAAAGAEPTPVGECVMVLVTVTVGGYYIYKSHCRNKPVPVPGRPKPLPPSTSCNSQPPAKILPFKPRPRPEPEPECRWEPKCNLNPEG